MPWEVIALTRHAIAVVEEAGHARAQDFDGVDERHGIGRRQVRRETQRERPRAVGGAVDVPGQRLEVPACRRVDVEAAHHGRAVHGDADGAASACSVQERSPVQMGVLLRLLRPTRISRASSCGAV
jgi:hypothetical protein